MSILQSMSNQGFEVKSIYEDYWKERQDCQGKLFADNDFHCSKCYVQHH